MEEIATLIHLTDLHLFKDPRQKMVDISPFCTLETIIKHLNQTKLGEPKYIILTGDISQDESQESYKLAQETLKKLNCPILATMGNHDFMPHFTETFGNPTQLLEIANWRILLLNSHYPQHVEGRLVKNDLDFLKYNLEKHREYPTLIFMHHHILASQSKWLDLIDLKNKKLFLKIITSYQNIRAIICGHVHQESVTLFREIPFFSTPATSWQFALNCKNFKLDNLMPGYRWVKLFADGTIKSSVTRLPYCEQFIPNQACRGY